MTSARRTMLGRTTAVLALGVVGAGMVAPAAQAVAPGANGRIAHFGYSAGTADSWVEHLDPLGGGPLVPVSMLLSGDMGGTVDRTPSWSPDGRLVFSGDPDGNAYVGEDAGPDLIVADAAATSRQNLTNTPDVFEHDPAWSPDGARIAYAVGPVFGPAESVWLMDADGSNRRRLGAGQQPAWSPDGRRLAFSRGGEILTMSRAGTDVRRLTYDPGADLYPTWSPDGRHIAWSTEDDVPGGAPRQELWMARTDGSAPRRLTSSSLAEWAPAFSPDGTLVAFSRQNPEECCPSLWIKSLSSDEERMIGGTDGADWERLNRAPVAALSASTQTPRLWQTVWLRSTSSDADGPLASQRWDLDGDGRFGDATGVSASVTLTAARPERTVSVRVRDADGSEAIASLVLRATAR